MPAFLWKIVNISCALLLFVNQICPPLFLFFSLFANSFVREATIRRCKMINFRLTTCIYNELTIRTSLYNNQSIIALWRSDVQRCKLPNSAIILVLRFSLVKIWHYSTKNHTYEYDKIKIIFCFYLAVLYPRIFTYLTVHIWPKPKLYKWDAMALNLCFKEIKTKVLVLAGV